MKCNSKLAALFCATMFASACHGAGGGGNNIGTGKPAAVKAEAGGTACWQPYEEVKLKDAEAFGLDRCFTESEISDSLFRRMYGKSFKAGCTTPRSDLRYLRVLHVDHKGHIRVGEMVCHKAVSHDLLAIFRRLFDARYPIERMVLIDNYDAKDGLSMQANNSSAFNFRFIAGTHKLSNHSQGLAVDINPLYNPYVKKRADGTMLVDPEAARVYADRSKDFPFKLTSNDLCVRLFKEHGFEWGGDWKSLKDYQHFEKRR